MKKEKVSPRLPEFGKHLQQTRINAQFSTQLDLATRLEVTQSLIAQLETGRIVDPSPNFLRKWAEVTGANYTELLLALVRDKYHPDDEKWELIELLLSAEQSRRLITEHTQKLDRLKELLASIGSKK